MSYLIALLCLALVAAAVTVYRLSGDLRQCQSQLRELDVTHHYTLARNRELNAELFSVSRTMLYDDRAIAIADLPADHPQKRKRKTIRKKAP
jgi:hypothetical protein